MNISAENVIETAQRRDSMITCVKSMKDYFVDNEGEIEQVLLSIHYILNNLKAFYYFHDLSMKLRIVLYLLSEYSNNQYVFVYIKRFIASYGDLIIAMIPTKTPENVLSEILSQVYYNTEEDTMEFSWRHQYAFEENVFNADEDIISNTQNYIEKHDKMKWKTFEQLANTFAAEIFAFPNCFPQLKAFYHRAILSKYLLINPLFVPTSNPELNLVNRISKLRKIKLSEYQIRSKFLPSNIADVPIQEAASVLYPKTVDHINNIMFLYLPHDIFKICCSFHEILFEEISMIMYKKNSSNESQSFMEFKKSFNIGQEDIVPINILVLVLSDVPNLNEIANFLKEYGEQVIPKSKYGFYMTNILSAIYSINNWDVE